MSTVSQSVAGSRNGAGIWCWFCVVLGAVLLLTPRGTFGTLPELPVVWGTALVSGVLATVIFRLTRASGANAWSSAAVLTNLYYFYRFGFGVLVIYYWDRFPWELPYMQARFFQQDARLELANSCHLILLGALGLALGSLLPVAIRESRHPWWEVDYSAVRARLLAMAPLVGAAFYLPESLRVLGGAIGFASYLLITIASCCLFDPRLRHDRGRWLLIIALAGLCVIPIGLMNGQVGFMVGPVVMVLFGFLLQRGRMPVKSVAVISVLALLFVFPLLTAYKAAAYTRGVGSFKERMQVSQRQLEAVSPRASREMAVDRFVARMAQSLPAIFYRYYPDAYPYERGRSFQIELSTLVPRFLWPDKPSMSYELNRYTAGVGLIKEGDETSAVFDAVTEYYVNFGLYGVFFMSIVHGYYIRWLGALFTARLHWAVAGALNVGLLLSNPEFFGVVQVFVSQTRNLPVWIFILYVLTFRRVSIHGRTTFPHMTAAAAAAR